MVDTREGVYAGTVVGAVGNDPQLLEHVHALGGDRLYGQKDQAAQSRRHQRQSSADRAGMSRGGTHEESVHGIESPLPRMGNSPVARLGG